MLLGNRSFISVINIFSESNLEMHFPRFIIPSCLRAFTIAGQQKGRLSSPDDSNQAAVNSELFSIVTKLARVPVRTVHAYVRGVIKLHRARL